MLNILHYYLCKYAQCTVQCRFAQIVTQTKPINKYHKRNTKEFIVERCREINTYKRLITMVVNREILSDEQKSIKQERSRNKSASYCHLSKKTFGKISEIKVADNN